VSLERALRVYDGAVLVASHDAAFLKAIASSAT
jgi:ATPase subunit of ABC transporter with duplicated ATPase domains